MIATPEIVEKVARALHGAKSRWFRWERVGEQRRRRVRKQAIAVLRALGYTFEQPAERIPVAVQQSVQRSGPRVRAPRVRPL